MVDMTDHYSAPARSSHYKAKITFVSPDSARNALQEHDSCFLGVSLENSNFTQGKTYAMAEWVSRRFARCIILIGDSIHRITLESKRSLSPAAAKTEALRLGSQFIETSESAFGPFRDQTIFTFLKCSQVQEWSSYERYHRRLREYFASDALFRASVERFGSEYRTSPASSDHPTTTTRLLLR
jgi:tRNA-dependent cyclodipeptide synthase